MEQNKHRYIQEGDFLECDGPRAIKTLGPVTFYPGQDHIIILVPGKKAPQVAVEMHQIRAVLRAGQEVIRFAACERCGRAATTLVETTDHAQEKKLCSVCVKTVVTGKNVWQVKDVQAGTSRNKARFS